MTQPATSPAHLNATSRGEAEATTHVPESRSSAGARLINLLVDPIAGFRGIGDDPTWALAVLVAIVARFGSLFVFYRPAVTPVKLIAGLVFQLATVVPTVLFASLVVWLAAKVCRVGVRWGPAFSVVTHVYVAYTLATVAFASVAGALLPESADVDLRSPPFTNLTSQLGESAPEVVRSLVEELDLRSAYVLLLLWLGLRGAAPDAPRSATAKGIATIAVVRLAGVITASLL